MRVVLTPTISVSLPIKNQTVTPNLLSDSKLYDADGEVRVGDVVRYGGKPCYIERFDGQFVSVVTMDERRLSIKLLPQQLGLVVYKGQA